MRIDDLNRTPVTQGTEKIRADSSQHAPEQRGRVDSGQSDQAEVSHLAQSLAAPDPAESSSYRLASAVWQYTIASAGRAVADAQLDVTPTLTE